MNQAYKNIATENLVGVLSVLVVVVRLTCRAAP